MGSKYIPFLCCVLLISCQLRNKHNTTNEFDNNYTTLPEEFLNSIHVCTEIPNPDSLKLERKQASGKRWLFWDRSKTNLYVAFTDGNPLVQQKVIQVAKEWEKYCGVEFILINSVNGAIEPDITISFKEKGSMSLVGKDSKTKVPSMNLGWLTPATSDEEYHRVVLHEFGHALGLVHEHQNPKNNISWNKETVYAYYWQKFGWPKQVTYYNFFEKYKENEMNSSNFDSLSIMMYEIPKEFTTNGFHTVANTQLSETDKKWIGTIYPKNN